MSERFIPYEEFHRPKPDLEKKQPERVEPLETEQGTAPKEVEARGKLMDRGIQDVPLSKISFNDNPVKGPADFHDVSYDVMRDETIRLQRDVTPAVSQGKDSQYFTDYDKAHNLDPSRGNTRIYHSYYEGNAIGLVKMGEEYYVDNKNGEHNYERLYMARELGLKTIPARVYEKVP